MKIKIKKLVEIKIKLIFKINKKKIELKIEVKIK